MLTMVTMMITGFATFCYSAPICQVGKCEPSFLPLPFQGSGQMSSCILR